MSQAALVIQSVRDIRGVSDAWIEWEFEKQHRLKTLVVEVDFSTDPNEDGFSEGTLDEIERIARDVLTHGTTMVISNLRVVPRRQV